MMHYQGFPSTRRAMKREQMQTQMRGPMWLGPPDVPLQVPAHFRPPAPQGPCHLPNGTVVPCWHFTYCGKDHVPCGTDAQTGDPVCCPKSAIQDARVTNGVRWGQRPQAGCAPGYVACGTKQGGGVLCCPEEKDPQWIYSLPTKGRPAIGAARIANPKSHAGACNLSDIEAGCMTVSYPTQGGTMNYCHCITKAGSGGSKHAAGGGVKGKPAASKRQALRRRRRRVGSRVSKKPSWGRPPQRKPPKIPKKCKELCKNVQNSEACEEGCRETILAPKHPNPCACTNWTLVNGTLACSNWHCNGGGGGGASPRTFLAYPIPTKAQSRRKRRQRLGKSRVSKKLRFA